MKVSVFWFFGASLLIATPFVARADEGADWQQVIELRQQIGEAGFRDQPAQAVEQLQAFNRTHKLDPILAAELTVQSAQITRDQLKSPTRR